MCIPRPLIYLDKTIGPKFFFPTSHRPPFSFRFKILFIRLYIIVVVDAAATAVAAPLVALLLCFIFIRFFCFVSHSKFSHC